MTDIHIPPEALARGEAIVQFALAMKDPDAAKIAAAAFRAIVEGWEGMHAEDDSAPWPPRLILPLPLKEKENG